jgi:hypothetical protein
MSILIGVETLVLILLAILVGGLLRSHAEILRRLEAGDSSNAPDGLEQLPVPRNGDTPAFDVAGSTPSGGAVQVAVSARRERGTLLAFLSSGCESCGPIWAQLQPSERPGLPAGAGLVVVTKDPSRESPSKIGRLAPPDLPVIMSSQAWKDYRVSSSPYFIYVDETGSVHSEGTSQTLEQALSLLTDAIADAPVHTHTELPLVSGAIRTANESATEVVRADDALSRAGIGPGHPSLYEP